MKIIQRMSEASSGEAAWLPRRPHRLMLMHPSAGANAPTIDITAPEPPRYPVDDVKEMKECHLHYPIGNMSMKVAIGSALPPGALHHNNPIPDGYARVTVEDIVQGFEDLEIDYATPEGERRLGDVKRQFILWKKKFIKFPGEAPRPTSPPPSGGGGGGSPTPPSRQPTPPPNPPPAGTPPPNPPPAKKQKQSWTINPDPYVPKTTKVPEPSLKPLLPRPWERSAEEVDAAAAAHHEKWKAEMKAEREPEPKPVFSEKQKKWAKSFLSTPSQAEKNMPDDYGRELRRQALILKKKKDLAEKEKKALEEEKEESKKSGKQVAQLGEQSKQSIPPLIVKAAGPDAELMDPAIIEARQHGMTVTVPRKSGGLGMTLRGVLGLEEAPMSDVAIRYVPNGPLVEPAQEEDLPAQMLDLLRWYKGYIKNNTGKEYIYAEVRHEHHFKHYYVTVHMSELFQLFNLRELDKSIISCYVLVSLSNSGKQLRPRSSAAAAPSIRRHGSKRVHGTLVATALSSGEERFFFALHALDLLEFLLLFFFNGGDGAPASWEGSYMTEDNIDRLIRLRRSRSRRGPWIEIEPEPQSGERAVLGAHFDRGLGLPASPFFRRFLEFFGLQPHHLPANALV
ncbi:hypothetical protein QYE76_054377 [Lolium multiflorum]|uniref:Uncharacterized protein n=1 Tax=Lolium multiflorum TaxID=4521 RepID=A0AAD8WMV2_LOLMU|nr:hypothetical protein QYE76_054377 [Lolium multiflorum]